MNSDSLNGPVNAAAIPEILALDNRTNLIRIPGEQDVPVTPRIRRLIDSAPFQRLKSISQLGLVSMVYPGATHSRFEHSLGVYRMSLLFLKRLSSIPRFRQLVTAEQAELLVVAALLHDVGHWPYCHPFEDMGIKEIPDHEDLARRRLAESEIPEILAQQFSFGIDELADLLEGKTESQAQQILKSILSGPIDVDKMDYLYRDSLHAGVPYGMHCDRGRLIGSLCLNKKETGLAITEKGCTAAELMVFARYVMFSEVYWHHTVRAATAMLQCSLYTLLDDIDLPEFFELNEAQFQSRLRQTAKGTDAERLVEGLFGPKRKLYKRLAQYTLLEDREVFESISRRSYHWLIRCSLRLIERINESNDLSLKPGDLLIDAPPPGLEVQFNLDVCTRDGEFRSLDQMSPVVKTLAQEQFDNYVKRVRIFVNPAIEAAGNFGFPDKSAIAELLGQAIDATNNGTWP